MARIRSPNYPQIDLADAIRRISAVFDKEHTHLAPREVIVQHMGYNGLNGASLSALSALLKYGLLERQGDEFKVSERAISILHPDSDKEKADAIRAAARSPALFAELLETYKEKLPSDENLRSMLIRRGFSLSAVSQVIDSFRKTMELSTSLDYNEPTATALQTRVTPTTIVSSPQTSRGRLPRNELGKHLIKNDFKVLLSVSGVEVSGEIVDREGMEHLIKALQLAQGILPDKQETTGAAPLATDVEPQTPLDDDELA